MICFLCYIFDNFWRNRRNPQRELHQYCSAAYILIFNVQKYRTNPLQYSLGNGLWRLGIPNRALPVVSHIYICKQGDMGRHEEK